MTKKLLCMIILQSCLRIMGNLTLISYFFFIVQYSFDYNDLLFHLIGHIMKHSALEIMEHLIKYIKRYATAVKYVGKYLLSRKGQMLDDYVDFMSTEGNCGDELSLYLAARMCCKQVAVIMKTSIGEIR